MQSLTGTSYAGTIAVDSRSARLMSEQGSREKAGWSDAKLLTMYSAPPAEAISLHDFEVYALDRLKGACGCGEGWERGRGAWRAAARRGVRRG
jgi:hypothetical protein